MALIFNAECPSSSLEPSFSSMREFSCTFPSNWISSKKNLTLTLFESDNFFWQHFSSSLLLFTSNFWGHITLILLLPFTEKRVNDPFFQDIGGLSQSIIVWNLPNPLILEKEYLERGLEFWQNLPNPGNHHHFL